MDRRGFLRNMAVGMAAMAAASAIPAVASQLLQPIVPVVPVTDPYEKYRRTLELMDEAIAFNRANMTSDEWKKKIVYPVQVEFHSKVNDVFAYMHSVFDIPEKTPENQQAVNAVLIEKNWQDIQAREIPPKIVDAAWVVLVVRTMLRDYSLPIDHRMVPEWQTFHNRYGDFILNG